MARADAPRLLDADPRSTLRGPLLLLAAAFCFSIMSVLVKLAGARIPPMQVVLARSVVTLLLSYAMLRRGGHALRGREPRLLVQRALLGFVALSFYFTSLTMLPIAEATVIQYTNPVFTAILAAIFLRERTSLRVGIGIAICLGGVLLVARPLTLLGLAPAASGARVITPLALAVALGGALFSAGAYTTVRRLRGEHPLLVVFYVPLISTPLSLPFVIAKAVWPTPLEWLVLLGVGVATQVSQMLFTRGLALVPAGRGTAIGYAQVVFSSVIGAIAWHEVPAATTLAGGLLIAFGTAATIWAR
ncbi:MAG: DMT family transporter [Myxococcales bacterium]|nr:DMT family transporter [Myxococcales bacterium]